jgi:hypothetical protein
LWRAITQEAVILSLEKDVDIRHEADTIDNRRIDIVKRYIIMVASFSTVAACRAGRAIMHHHALASQ